MNAPDNLNYARYLKLQQLLELQVPVSEPPQHDELLFIIVHQASELWFAQLVSELEKIRTDFTNNHLYRVITSFRRTEAVMKVLSQQIDVLTTMTPMSFTRFRSLLSTASGFESMQFREIEILLGMKNDQLFEHYPADLPGRNAAEARLTEPTVPDAFHTFLAHRGVELPPAITNRPVTARHEPNAAVQDGVFRLYREGGEYRILFELMVDFDESLQNWRYRHIKITERTIGNKQGTGGSRGLDFLKASLYLQAFPNLWAIRHRF